MLQYATSHTTKNSSIFAAIKNHRQSATQTACSGPYRRPHKRNIILCREMSEDTESKWKIASRKRQRELKSPIPSTPRKKSKNVQHEETADFKATTLVMDTAEWISEVHAIIALSTDHPELKIITKRGLTKTLIRTKNKATEDTLLQMTELQNKAIKFRPQVPRTMAIGIVQRVPIAVPMELLKATQEIQSAERMTVWDNKKKVAVPTMSGKALSLHQYR